MRRNTFLSYPEENSREYQLCGRFPINQEILLADEPTGNLDSENSKKVMEILKHLNEKGMTIIMVTHDLSLAEYGSRIIHIEDGKIVER